MNIVIVGGGHSGWLSALMCSKKIKADITVIESKKINVSLPPLIKLGVYIILPYNFNNNAIIVSYLL